MAQIIMCHSIGIIPRILKIKYDRKLTLVLESIFLLEIKIYIKKLVLSKVYFFGENDLVVGIFLLQ